MTTKTIESPFGKIRVKIDPELDKRDGQILFSEKHRRAEESLKKWGLPKEVEEDLARVTEEKNKR